MLKAYAAFNGWVSELGDFATVWLEIDEFLSYERIGMGVGVKLTDGQMRTVDHRRIVVSPVKPDYTLKPYTL